MATAFNNNFLDSFGRLRVSNPTGIFEDYHEYDESPLLWNFKNSGTGSKTHRPNYSSVELSTGGTSSGAKAIYQTKDYHRYQAGKSHLITFSGVLGSPKANVRVRYGLFDDNNGLYFELTSEGLFACLRSKVSGSVIDTRVPKNQFSIAPIFNADTTQEVLYFIDFEWQSAGKVRMGVYDDGQPVILHEFNRNSSLKLPYMTTPNLPIRMEIENTGVATSSTTCLQTCVSVSSEGGREAIKGLPTSISNGISSIAVTTRRAILSIRPKATFNSIVNRAQIIEQSFDVLAKTNDCYYEIVYNPTFTTGGGALTWTSVSASSVVEYSIHGDANAGAFTGGLVLDSGFVSSGSGTRTGVQTHDILSRLPLTLDIDGANPIAISIVITSLSGTSNVSGSLNWKEIY